MATSTGIATAMAQQGVSATRTDFVQNRLTRRFTAQTPLKKHKTTRFVCISCCDRDYMVQVQQFLEPLYEQGVDFISKPGGPRGMYKDFKDSRRLKICVKEMQFCVEHHGARDLILISHTNCGKYKHKYQNRNLTPHELDQKAKQHLLKLKAALGEAMPDLNVHLFFIEVEGQEDGNPLVEFVPVVA